MPRETALHRLHSALGLAARRYGEALRASDGAPTLADRAMHALVLQLGLPANLIGVAHRMHSVPVPAGHEAAMPRLRLESRRLARLARARSPAYDLNRHIAVRRLVLSLEQAASPPAPSRVDVADDTGCRPTKQVSSPAPRILVSTTEARR